jgi:Na+/H+-translocating membrane pyrophosphatase
MLVFVFSGFAMKAVGTCASEVVVEVRREIAFRLMISAKFT